jgi:predicted HTH transcriptional regulator
MPTDRNRTRELLLHPSEALNVEVKRWLDPDREIAVAKIVKAIFGLRNRNGGVLIFGFDNATLQPNDDDRPNDLRASQLEHVQTRPFRIHAMSS